MWKRCAGGLYAGYVPNMLRNSIISTSEIISYDLSKTAFTKAGVPDGPGLHMLSGVAAGLVATVLGRYVFTCLSICLCTRNQETAGSYPWKFCALEE